MKIIRGIQKMKDLVKELLKTYEDETESIKILAHAVVSENDIEVLWKVVETCQKGIHQKKHRYIGCDLMSNQNDEWQCKSMVEMSDLTFYSCPTRFLKMVPPVCPAWRDKVMRYHKETVMYRREFQKYVRDEWKPESEY